MLAHLSLTTRGSRFSQPPAISACFFALFLVASAGGASAHDLTNTFLKGPYLQAPGATTMTIIWESPTNKPGLVRYGLDGQLDRERRLPRPRKLIGVSSNAFSITNVTARGKTNVTQVTATNIVFLYELTLANLRPNSVYSYSAETEGVRTPPKQFKTFGAHPNTVRFIAYGDTRTNPKTHAAVAANFKRHAPEFILHTGDLVTDGRRYDQWGKEFFGPLADVIDEIPILPAIGNHEQDGINYLHYLHLPGKERWYSYDVGPVHVLSLDYRFPKKSHEQFAFARQDLLNSRAPWKLVFLHYPVFNIGGHGTGWGHDSYLPLFHQTKVDLVLAGHSHIYERFRPVAPRRKPDAWPITFITTGGGGAPLYTTYTHPALAARMATNHFVLIEATPTTLKGRAITTNDTVFDAFELKKSGGRLTPDYTAEVYPEEALKLSFDAAPSLTAELASAPTTNSPAQVMFTIRKLKSAKEPVELEIGLTPESAVNFKIEGGPLRVTAPFAAKSNIAVWARVRATGKRTIVAEGKDKVLAPTLIFQAKLLAGADETLAYGQKCKVTEKAAAAAQYLTEPRPVK